MDPLSYWDRIWEQRHVIADAPESFGIAIAISLFIMWKVLRSILGKRERDLEADLRSRDNMIAQLKAALAANAAQIGLLQEKVDEAHRKRLQAENDLARLSQMIPQIADLHLRQLATDASTTASQANSAFKQVESLVFTLVGQTTPDPNTPTTRMIGPLKIEEPKKE